MKKSVIGIIIVAGLLTGPIGWMFLSFFVLYLLGTLIAKWLVERKKKKKESFRPHLNYAEQRGQERQKQYSSCIDTIPIKRQYRSTETIQRPRL